MYVGVCVGGGVGGGRRQVEGGSVKGTRSKTVSHTLTFFNELFLKTFYLYLCGD